MKNSKAKRIKVVELFAGVGGFRIGLERASTADMMFETIWNNQWEPATKGQHASLVYMARFGKDGHSNIDIEKVPTKEIPEHDLLVGGFPCQDYSVASTLKHAKGLEGKKGVLWWSIYRILKEKGPRAPKLLMLENVDRLLKSPASQRGRDFAIMLGSLHELGYAVEWRVINAADYGMPQRRRRVYILGYKKGSSLYKELKNSEAKAWLSKEGVIAQAFPVEDFKVDTLPTFTLHDDLAKLSKEFNKGGSASPFENAGVVCDGVVHTYKTVPVYKGKHAKLKDFLESDKNVPEEFIITKESLKEWQFLKGGKKEKRVTKGGFEYEYSEGPMAFPDPLDKPSRTIVTGEGGASPSRFKHVVTMKNGNYRRLLPIELEQLNMFPKNHTLLDGVSDVKRAFFMGNALVVGVVTKLGEELRKRI